MPVHQIAHASPAATLAEMIDGYVSILTSPGTVAYANQRALLGRRPDEIVGRPFVDLVPEPRRPRLRDALDELFAGRDVGTLHTQLRRANGVPIDVEGSLTRLRLPDQPLAALAVFVPRKIDLRVQPAPYSVPIDRDIVLTERQRAVLQLFASGYTTKQVAHQLDIAVKTVHNHLTQIYRLLDAQSLVQATMIAAQLGIVEFGAAVP